MDRWATHQRKLFEAPHEGVSHDGRSLAGRVAAGRGAGGGSPGPDDPRGEGGPARQSLDRQRPPGPLRGRSGPGPERPDGGRVRHRERAAPGAGRPGRPRAPHPDLRQRAGEPGRGGRGARPAAGDRGRGLPFRHPGDRPRGMPHRGDHLRRHGLPGGHRLGCDLRPGTDRRDGCGERPRPGPARCPPRAFTADGRRPGLPLGPGGGDPRRGSLPGGRTRLGLRPRSSGRRDHRHSQAFHRVLGLPGRA